MPRPRLFRSDKIAYHVTARSNNKDWFYLDTGPVWEICVETIHKCFNHYFFEVYAFVLMSNHFHLIIGTPNRNLDQIMRYFTTETSKAIAKATRRINHVFGGRYKWTTLPSAHAAAYVYKYVHRNPVRAGIATRVENYRYNALFCKSEMKIPLCEGIGDYWSRVPKDLGERLDWLNRPTTKEMEELITKALRRYEFQFSKRTEDQKGLRDLSSSYGVIRPTTHFLGTESR